MLMRERPEDTNAVLAEFFVAATAVPYSPTWIEPPVPHIIGSARKPRQ
jgi:hypothetical protein